MKNVKSIYPRFFRSTSPQMLSFMHDLSKPLQRPTFDVALVSCGEKEKEIDYSQIDKMGCTQIGTHIKDDK